VIRAEPNLEPGEYGMAISLGFGPADLARCRFACSPVFETLQAIRIATGVDGPGPGPHHRRWLQDARPRLRALDLRPITLLQPRRGYTPDFLSPPPQDGGSDIGAELARMAATPAPVVRREIELSLRREREPARELERLLLGDPADVLSLLTQLVRAAWHVLVEPVWPRVRAALEADIEYRSRRLAAGGLDLLFADLDPALHWTGGRLVREPGGDEHIELGGRGVLLMPSVFKWDEAIVITEPPWQPTVTYRARGLADLWQPAHASAINALERLVGRTRATLLAGLDEPASTTSLAQEHGLAPGTVSEHLKVLRDAGLVVGERQRYEIRYRRTRLGSELVRGGR
jgi:DNA-binding transcriptional ArsR family regulator